jgi:saccharopine dehydrogenase (NAD+, L-lysine-forming)
MHLWVRAECRSDERRVGLLPDGAAELLAEGVRVTVEYSDQRIIPAEEYSAVGVELAETGSWRQAPKDTIVFGLKELPEDGTPLIHRHIMFGHAYKGQPAGKRLLRRFAEGGGVLLDLEYLTDREGKRVAAFGYWAGYAGAAVTFMGWLEQQAGASFARVAALPNSKAMIAPLKSAAGGMRNPLPRVIIIGARGRVGSGARDACEELGLPVTEWDKEETESGGPFPEVLEHEIFLNCILAAPGCPVFIGEDAGKVQRKLRLIGDIACDPESSFSPIRVYDHTTSWSEPFLRIADDPPLDVMAIDNLPSLLPSESSADFATQLLPHLLELFRRDKDCVWQRAEGFFDKQINFNQ